MGFFTDGHNTGKQKLLQVIERAKCAHGSQPYFMVDAGTEALDQGDLSCSVARQDPFPAGSTYRESATCSNRGVCDQSTGRCNCFDGYFGLACDHVNTYIQITMLGCGVSHASKYFSNIILMIAYC